MLKTNKAVAGSGTTAETVQSIQQFIMDTDPTNPKNVQAGKDASTSKFKVIDVNSVINGKYSAMDSNIAINGVVARVVVDRCNFDDFLNNKSKYVKSSMRGTKRKLQESDLEELLSEDTGKSNLASKKRRGRSAKKSTPVDPDYSETSNDSDYNEKQTRSTTEKAKSKQIIRTRLSLENPQFNGGSPGSVSTSRIRKPNSRLQDFVVSSSLGYYAPSPTNKPVKELSTTPKEKPLKKTNKDPLDDPLNITQIENKTKPSSVVLKTTRRTTDEVRSFLPVFDESLPSDESDFIEEKPTLRKKPIKEKENQVDNLIKTPKPNSPPKLRSTPVETKIDISKLQKSIAKTLESHKQPVGGNNNKTKEVKLKTAKNKMETKMNGSNSTSSYVLVDNDLTRNRGKAQKIADIDFNKLVRSLKLVKLPAANWKIRIVVSKQQTITEVTFTNKEVHERCIKFSRTFTGYVITFGKTVVNLLGAPSKISSFNDVSILLDIVHHISLNDPVLEYITSSNV